MRFRFLLVSILIYHCVFAQTRKHALLIGIGNYDKAKTGWRPLSSGKDVQLVRESLVGAQKFLPENIYMVVDKDATKAGIVKAMEDLIGKVGKGDVVFIHVSSHGIQLEDDNEDEIDHYDEAIVPIDAIVPKGFADHEYSVKEKKYLRDDLFGQLIERLRETLGTQGDVVVTMDLCHSGSASRGFEDDEAVARGLSVPLVSPTFKDVPLSTENLKEFRDKVASKGDGTNLATYVVFSAGRAEEPVYEVKNDNGEWMGPLSYALCKSFDELSDKTSYRTFFSRIENEMLSKSSRQHPVVEGNGIDKQFWGGKYERQKPFFQVSSKDGNDIITSNIIKLMGGQFAGLDQGATVSLFSPGKNPMVDSPITRGVVTKPGDFSSEVTLEKALNKRPAEVWVFLTEPVYNVKPVVLRFSDEANSKGLKLQSKYSEPEKNTIKNDISELKLIKFTGTPELKLVKGDNEDSLIIVQENSLFALVTGSTLKDELKKYIKYKFLRELQVKDSTLDVEVRFVPVVNGEAVLDKEDTKQAKGMEFKVGDKIAVWVKNNTRRDIYINILDLQPDGVINAIFPREQSGITPEELLIKAGQTVLFDAKKNQNMVMEVGPPYGTETMKIFIGKTKMNVQMLATDLGGAARSVSSALESIFSDIDGISSRSVTMPTVLTSGEGSISNIQFRIKK